MATRSTYGVDDTLSPSDQEMFSLFLQYPEIDFDKTDDDAQPVVNTDLPGGADVESSPTSTVVEEGSNANTLVGCQNCLPILATSIRDADPVSTTEWASLVHLMQQSKLPPECLRYYTLLGQRIISVGVALFGTAPTGRPATAVPATSWLLKCVEYSCRQAEAQVNGVAYLRSLVAFNVTFEPARTQIWSTYLQRAKLIVSTVALPSKDELALLESVIRLFDASVHHEFLEVSDLDVVDRETAKLLNELYDKLMTWLHYYKRWCGGMKELKDIYVQPLIKQFSQSDEAQEEFNNFQERINSARAVLNKPADDTVELTAKMVRNLNLSARKPGPETELKRSRTKYKREHTL